MLIVRSFLAVGRAKALSQLRREGYWENAKANNTYPPVFQDTSMEQIAIVAREVPWNWKAQRNQQTAA
jgi:hypothetical protein